MSLQSPALGSRASPPLAETRQLSSLHGSDFRLHDIKNSCPVSAGGRERGRHLAQPDFPGSAQSRERTVSNLRG